MIGPNASYFEPDTVAEELSDAIDAEYGRLMAAECNPTSPHMIYDTLGGLCDMPLTELKDLAEALQVGNLLGAGAALDSIVRKNAQARALAAAQRVAR